MTRERSWFYDTALPYKWLLHTTCPSTTGLRDEKAEKPIAPSLLQLLMAAAAISVVVCSI